MGCCDSKDLEKNVYITDNVSICEQLGGEPAVDAAVEIFYKKVLADSNLNGFFAETNMNFQKKHQKNFITY